jgi:hypothetical protein
MNAQEPTSNLVPVPTDVVMLSVTAVLAVMALAAAVVAVRAARRSTAVEVPEAVPPAQDAPERPQPTGALVPLDTDEGAVRVLAPRHVEGRVIVPPTGQQVVGAALSRPHVRLAILIHGLTYALRPESRDRITALMRREYRRRRRQRLAAGRRAVRATRPTADAWMAESWIGELPGGDAGRGRQDRALPRPHASTRVES